MNPHYFKDELTFNEAKLYLDGMNRRYQQGWERTRFEVRCIVKALTGEAPDITLPWDEKDNDDNDNELTDEELQELLGREQERMNKEDGNNNIQE